MRVLVVGGTGFLGKATAEAAIAQGFDVTVMTRSGVGVADGAATLIADRGAALPDLTDQFDAVIDTCGYAPDMVAPLAQATGPVHYVFVSSISVYDDMSEPQFDETAQAPTATPEDLQLADSIAPELRCTADPYGEAYGRLKRSCEVAAEAAFEGECTLIRLGLIVGPRDYTERFTWWIRRSDGDAALLVPGPKDRLVQVIDVRDAADFLVLMAKDRHRGVFHLTGAPLTMGKMLKTMQAVAGKAPLVDYYPLSTFTQAGLRHWTDLPLIVPDDPRFAHMLNVSIDKATAAGLKLRPLSETITTVLQWDRQQRDHVLTCGMSPDNEAAVRAIAG